MTVTFLASLELIKLM